MTTITAALDNSLLAAATIADLPRQRTTHSKATVAAIICRLKILTVTLYYHLLYVVLSEKLHVIEHILEILIQFLIPANIQLLLLSIAFIRIFIATY